MDYARMVDVALRGVVRQALARAGEQGLPPGHHFYVTFRTSDAGVRLPEHLRQRFPQEMTIVLQHQFWGLEVTEEAFEVTLSFNKVNERLCVPFDSLLSFYDPSVQFGLQFQGAANAGQMLPATSGQGPGVQSFGAEAAGGQEPAEPNEPEAANPAEKVVPLDQFRKKP